MMIHSATSFWEESCLFANDVYDLKAASSTIQHDAEAQFEEGFQGSGRAAPADQTHDMDMFINEVRDEMMMMTESDQVQHFEEEHEMSRQWEDDEDVMRLCQNHQSSPRDFYQQQRSDLFVQEQRQDFQDKDLNAKHNVDHFTEARDDHPHHACSNLYYECGNPFSALPCMHQNSATERASVWRTFNSNADTCRTESEDISDTVSLSRFVE